MGCGSSAGSCFPGGGEESDGNSVLDFRHFRQCNIGLGFTKIYIHGY